jgi:hypothetical protein
VQLDTARYLAAGVQSKIVVLTGSTLPEHHRDSDAAFNLGCAVGALSSLTTPGVYVAMGGLVLPAQLVSILYSCPQNPHLPSPACGRKALLRQAFLWILLWVPIPAVVGLQSPL